MVSKDEAMNTFKALVSGVVSSVPVAQKEADPTARNYKLIAGVVLVLVVVVGGGVWWWMKKKPAVGGVGGVSVTSGSTGKVYTLTPSVKSGGVSGVAVRPASGGKS